jgi:hypothetical protein
MVAQLGIDQIHVDLFARDVASLRHFGEGAREVDDGVAAVVFGEEEDGEVWPLGGGRGIWGRVGGEVGGAEGEGWFARGAEVEFEGGFDGGVGLGEVVL